ncbi:secondary thiamine-phosphate synthase enzyme [Silvibacterium bohemicum]|uniref:Secondary thiamine-phosphate synthase enzyme n=1 Tax=Silvibacterium bohemicum TaxID=1577686 RepID=A0A841K3Y7_9BACT|nr:secondary thiamine-phosphate synthase enzyme YjbQ [Silvibacterium bohemicum]MBB6147277.1 secondary thiamine-phosphate synthase enzyme [Silvibacterium bohemicum]
MKRLKIKTTRKREILDITEIVEQNLSDISAREGICYLNILHTTAALTTADLDPGTDLDMLDAFEAMMPKLKYRHPHNPAHAPDHILSSILGTALTIPMKDNSLVLGTWQRVIVVELDGPRERDVVLSFVETRG